MSDKFAEREVWLTAAIVLAPDECWTWPFSRNPQGYGMLRAGSRMPRGAHRVVYERLVGPIPDALELDHLCRNRACVNPQHLEPVTHRENSLRGASIGAMAVRTGRCAKGHSLNDAFIVKRDDGARRQCRKCSHDAGLRRRARLLTSCQGEPR